MGVLVGKIQTLFANGTIVYYLPLWRQMNVSNYNVAISKIIFRFKELIANLFTNLIFKNTTRGVVKAERANIN